MPKNALDNPLVLPILGLLIERPMHAYAVFSEVRRRYDYATVRNATVYTLLGTLTDVGWIASTTTGDRPALATTPAGAAALAERVRAHLRDADLPGGPDFVTALAYLAVLTPDDATAVLTDRAGRLRRESQRLAELSAASGVHELHMIEVHFLSARLRHDADWLGNLVVRIRSGDLRWPAVPVE